MQPGTFSDYARFYDAYYAGKDYNGECRFLEAAFARFGGRPRTVLDIACGSGSHGCILAASGYELTGVDRSAEMLALYQRKLEVPEARGWSVRLLQQDMRELDAGGPFDAAVCMFDAIDYLPENGDLSGFLERVRSHLKPGGTFVFDFWHAAPILGGHDPVRVREFELDGIRIIRTSRTTLDVAEQVARVEFHVLALDGDRLVMETRETHVMRYFLSQEMGFILNSAGWDLLHMCTTFDLDSPVTADSWHLAAIARAR